MTQDHSVANGHLVAEDESLDGNVLIAAKGDRRWKARLTDSAPFGYSPKDDVYVLVPIGGDYGRGAGGVRRLVRSSQQLIAWGWRVVA